MSTQRQAKRMFPGSRVAPRVATPVQYIFVNESELCRPVCGKEALGLVSDASNAYTADGTFGIEGRYAYFAGDDSGAGTDTVLRYDWPTITNETVLYEANATDTDDIYWVAPTGRGGLLFYEALDVSGSLYPTYGAFRIGHINLTSLAVTTWWSPGQSTDPGFIGTDGDFGLNVYSLCFQPKTQRLYILADNFDPAVGYFRANIWSVTDGGTPVLVDGPHEDSYPTGQYPYALYAATPDGAVWGAWADYGDSDYPNRMFRLDAQGTMLVSEADTGYGYGFYGQAAMVGTQCGGVLTSLSLFDPENLSYVTVGARSGFVPGTGIGDSGWYYAAFNTRDLGCEPPTGTEQRVDAFAPYGASPTWDIAVHSNTVSLFYHSFRR